MRQIVLDTETTGLDWKQGHRVIEIGCVEILDRRITDNDYHCYINPEREVDAGAAEVHGMTLADLSDKPRFADVAQEFMDYVGDAELVIHNAPFDLGFLDYELRLLERDKEQLSKANKVLDTLLVARQMNPGQRNSLDALCKRFGVDNSSRDLHGALLDAELLARVYLLMTGGQVDLSLAESVKGSHRDANAPVSIDRSGREFARIAVAKADIRAHEAQLDLIDKNCSNGALWRRSELTERNS